MKYTKKKHITPLRNLNAQSVSLRSLITAHNVGVLNMQRCKKTFRKKRHIKNTQKRKYFGGTEKDKTITLPEDSIHKILNSIHPSFHIK